MNSIVEMAKRICAEQEGEFSLHQITPKGLTHERAKTFKNAVRQLHVTKQLIKVGQVSPPHGGICNVYIKSETFGTTPRAIRKKRAESKPTEPAPRKPEQLKEYFENNGLWLASYYGLHALPEFLTNRRYNVKTYKQM